MRIGIAQIDTRAGDLEATATRMVALSGTAAEQGADLLVFPMAALTGPLPVRESEQDDFLVDVMDALVRLSEEVSCPCIVPVVGALDGQPAPEAVLVGDEKILPLKMQAYAQSEDAGLADDEDAPAPDLPEFEFGGMRLGVAFTYEDLDDYDDFDIDVDAIIYIAGYGYAADDVDSALGGDLAENRYVADARTTGAWIVGVGSVGGYGTSVYSGSSFALSPEGELVASLPACEEGLAVAEVGGSPADGDEEVLPEVYNRPLYLWQTLVLGLRDYLHKLDQRSAVLALDGSVGSMVVAALATDALGPTNVHAIVDVPGDVSREACCQRLARNLRIDVRDAGDMRAAAFVAKPEDALLRRGIVDAYLAVWAAEVGGVVLSGADKTALALGEKRRALGADALKPVGDVYRSDVLELMRMRNTISPVFPSTRLAAGEAPEVGFDHASLPDEAWCAEVDQVLSDHIEYGRSVTEVAADLRDDRLVEAVLARLDESEPWRVGRGLYLMVSTVTLFDARRPVGLAWHNRIRADRDAASTLDRVMRRVGAGIGLSDLRGGPTSRKDAHKEPDDGDAGAAAPSRGDARQVKDALSFLRDFSYGGGFRPKGFGDAQDGGQGGPANGFEDSHGRTWPNPFSEN